MIETGKVFRDYRKMYRLTQEQLAERLRVEPKTIIRWENGNPPRNVERLYHYADLLGIPPVLFGLQPFRKRSPKEIDEVVDYVWALMAKAHYREARNTIESLLLDVHIIEDDEHLLGSLGRAYHLAGHVVAVNTRTGEVEQATKHFRAMEDVARQIDDDTLLNIAMTYHGDMLRRAGRVDEALEYLEGTREITPDAETTAQGNNMQLLGRVYAVRGDMQAFDRAMKLSEEIAAEGTTLGKIGISYSMGTVYEEWGKILARHGRMDKALKYLDLADQHLPRVPRWELVTKVTRSEALVYGGELDDGIKMAKDAAQQAIEQGHLRMLERVYAIKRYLRRQRMKFGKADDELGEILDGQIER